MRENTGKRKDRWMDRTLSVLRASRLEACGKELAGLGGFGLFDPEATDADAERLFEQSYYKEEDHEVRLHSLEELRMRVLSQFPAEMGLLNQDEFTLLLKLSLFGGEMPVFDWNDLPAARSLVYRMWCRIRPEKGNWIHMPRQLCVSALMMLASEELKTVRDVVGEIIDTADNTLYLAGMMPAEVVAKDMGFRLQESLAADKPELYTRLIRSSFVTTLNRDGRLMIVHPGLAEPVAAARSPHPFGGGMDQEALSELYNSLMDVEDPLYDRMMGLIQGLCRQETGEEETVEDLILLAKQDAPLEEMKEVLASRIICLPTEEMISALKDLHDWIPKWNTLNMERLQ